MLSTGASPIVPPLPGVERALILRDVEDVDRLVEQIESAQTTGAPSASSSVPVFIGVELAENLRHRDLAVTVVELADQCWRRSTPRWRRPSPTGCARTECASNSAPS